MKGVSGGERKRTSIAFELISDPQVIILDEPTSGLDSLTSFIIVNYLKKLAYKRGCTVLMTIHQPGTDIYEQFDRLFLMVEGRMVYQGAANQAIHYFERHFGLKCEEFENPAEFLIEHVHHDNKANVQRYDSYFATYEKENKPLVEREMEEVESKEIVKREI